MDKEKLKLLVDVLKELEQVNEQLRILMDDQNMHLNYSDEELDEMEKIVSGGLK